MSVVLLEYWILLEDLNLCMKTSESNFFTPWQPFSNMDTGRNISLFFGFVYLDVSESVVAQTHFSLLNVTLPELFIIRISALNLSFYGLETCKHYLERKHSRVSPGLDVRFRCLKCTLDCTNPTPSDISSYFKIPALSE